MSKKTLFSKIIRPGTIKQYAGDPRASIYCKIELREGGELSITGVIGPRSNGDAVGGCGQIVMSLREPGALDTFEPVGEWTREGFEKFLEVWDRWHLNGTRAYDDEMEAAGWPELAKKEMRGYEFTLTREAYAAKQAAEQAALKALRAGEVFTPTTQQVADAARPGSYTVWAYAEEPAPEPLEAYERAKDLWGPNKGNVKHPERKTLGWLYPKDHPDGLLTRKLREDGPGYGSQWFKSELPEDVVQYLRALPDTDIKPAWV